MLATKALRLLPTFLAFLAVHTAGAEGQQEFLRSIRDQAGFCIQIGCGDGGLTADMATNQRLTVHALEVDGNNVAHARERLQSRALYGRAVVEQWSAPWLPYADNLANVVVTENAGKLTTAEMLRVLAPTGVLWTKKDGVWQSQRKPWPRQFDEWTHWRHGADGNMVSRDTAVSTPTGIRWIAGPPQDPGGRKWYYDHLLLTSAGRNFYIYEDAIVARDSFNGCRLWSREMKIPSYKETGAPSQFKPGNRTSKMRPVALGQRLYVAADGKLVTLDAKDGQTALTFCELETPREILILNKLLLVSDKSGVRAFSLEGELRWQWKECPRRMVAGDGHLFCVFGAEVVSLSSADGKERWRVHQKRAAEAVTCSYGCGVLALEASAWADHGDGSGLLVLAGDSGRVLWQRDYIPGMTHYKEARSFFEGGLLWVQEQVSKKPMVVKFLGLHPRTGLKRREVGTCGLHCSPPVATQRFFIAPEMEFTDIKTGTQTRGRMTRHSCRNPYVPANGLLYTFPVQCECFPMLRGYMALAQTPPARNPQPLRLQRGPAFERAALATMPVKPEDWPMYRRDAYRSGSTSMNIEGEPKPLWNVQIANPSDGLHAADWADNPFVRGLLTPPVCAAGTLVVALPDQHRVLALDADNGKRRWSFTVGGRVDTPPSIAGDRVVFGSHDGHIYCLDLKDGSLAWRFRAAPHEARIAIYGQMESPWPVVGSALIENGVAYCAAGRHPQSDGGVRVLALHIRDGTLLWEKPITDMGVQRWYSGLLPKSRRKIGLDFEPVDLLARDGDCVAMSRWRFEAKTGEMALAFSSTNYTGFSSLEVPRGAWGFGIRQTKHVLDKPPTVFDSSRLTQASTNDVALLQAGTSFIVGTGNGELKSTDWSTSLGAPLLRDGLIAANGRLYAVTKDGKLWCLAPRAR